MMVMFVEWVKIWKERVMAYLKELSQYLLESLKKPWIDTEYLAAKLKFRPSASQIQV